MVEQRTYEWYKARLAKITASGFDRLRTPAGRASYAEGIKKELDILRRIDAGEQVALGPSFTAKSTDWGIKHEPAARAEYELRHDCDLIIPRPHGFVLHPVYDFIGCSPDGLVVDRDGGAELKCPWKSEIHLHTLGTCTIPPQYNTQVQVQIWVCELDWIDFVSFDPRQLPTRRYFEVRIHRDDSLIRRLKSHALETWGFVQSNAVYTPQDDQDIPTLF